MHSPGQSPQDPYRPQGNHPPQDRWQSPWSDEERQSFPRTSTSYLGGATDGGGVADHSPLIEELNATFARQRRRHMNAVLGFSVLVFSFTVVAWIYVRDDDMPWDADLITSHEGSSSGTNPVADHLRQALEEVKPTDAEELAVRSPSLWDTPALSRLVAANAATFGIVRELADADWQPSSLAWKSQDLGSNERQWQALGVAKEAAAAYYSRRGQDEAAVLAGMEMAVMAQKLESVVAWPTYYARGIEMHERACKAIASMLRQASMDARMLSNVQAEFERLTPTDTMLKERLTGFYEFERRLIVGARPGDPWDEPAANVTADRGNKLFFKPHQTLAVFASSLRELSDQVSKTPTAITHQIAMRIGPQSMPAGFPGGPNCIGMKYANERIWHYAKLLDYLALQRTHHALVLTLFGVRRYALDHGKAPEKLEDLLPRYFTALPTDPYSGDALRYDAARGLIYSVGTDFRSDGGRANDDPLSDDTEPTVMVR